MADDLDMINRDPNNINEHIQVSFEDVLAEPEDIRSIDCVWRLSYKCFTFWNVLCYRLTTLFCGLCIACHWGCEFASIAFYHIWFVTPCLRILEINCGCIKKIWGTCIKCCLDPVCESCGLIFSAFKK